MTTFTPEIFDVRVGALDYGTVVCDETGWAFFSNTRHGNWPSRQPTARHAVPAWVPHSYKLVPRKYSGAKE